MTRDLRSALEDLATSEGLALARSAPTPAVEARRVAAGGRRRRAVRVAGGLTGAAAATVLVGVVAVQGLPGPAPQAPAASPTATLPVVPPVEPQPPTPSPTPATPNPTPHPDPTTGPPAPAPDAQESPSSPEPTWPAAVTEEVAMYSGEGPWWVVWVAIRPAGSPEGAPDAVVGELGALGYETSGTPVRCVDPWLPGFTSEELDVLEGWPLYFRTSADAETFVRSWGRPVTGPVEGSIACDWG